MIIYNYSPFGGAYTGEGEAMPNPLQDGEYLLPAFSTDIAPPAPIDGHRIVWDQALNQGAGGWTQPAIVIPPTDYDALHRNKCAQVDAMAEKTRLNFVSHGQYQAITYRDKEDEAARWQANASPALDPLNATDKANYPYITGEIGVTGIDAAAVVAEWQTLAGQWRSVNAQIEKIRLTAKRDIIAASAAQNQAGIDTAYATAVTQFNAVIAQSVLTEENKF